MIVIPTPVHCEAFSRKLTELGGDAKAAASDGQLLILDAEETLGRFMLDGQPDWSRFDLEVGATVRKFCQQVNHTALRAYGEMVGILWQAGQIAAAIRLEEFWNEVLRLNAFKLYCAYPIDIFGAAFHLSGIDAVLCAHTHLVPTDPDASLERARSTWQSTKF